MNTRSLNPIRTTTAKRGAIRKYLERHRQKSDREIVRLIKCYDGMDVTARYVGIVRRQEHYSAPVRVGDDGVARTVKRDKDWLTVLAERTAALVEFLDKLPADQPKIAHRETLDNFARKVDRAFDRVRHLARSRQ